MKKIKKYIIIAILILGIFKFDSVLIGIMGLVDTVGYATGIQTIELIDGLNEIYYRLGYS